MWSVSLPWRPSSGAPLIATGRDEFLLAPACFFPARSLRCYSRLTPLRCVDTGASRRRGRELSAEHATEAFTWVTSALLAGVGIGLAAGGALLESFPSNAALLALASL